MLQNVALAAVVIGALRAHVSFFVTVTTCILCVNLQRFSSNVSFALVCVVHVVSCFKAAEYRSVDDNVFKSPTFPPGWYQFLHGSRKFCQRGSNTDFFVCFFIVDGM